MSVSDSKVTQNSVQNAVLEHIGAGSSTSRSHHKDLDFDAFYLRVGKANDQERPAGHLLRLSVRDISSTLNQTARKLSSTLTEELNLVRQAKLGTRTVSRKSGPTSTK
jgi:hypothetical protein